MATTNQERVGKAMELLRAGLAPFVECEVHSALTGGHYLAERGAPMARGGLDPAGQPNRREGPGV